MGAHRKSGKLKWLLLTPIVTWCCLWPTHAFAYVGPGAGFAFVSSTFFLIATIFVVLFSLMFWPIRYAIAWYKGRKAAARAKAKRVIVLGLDGFDPVLVNRFMAAGKMPNFEKLAEKGTFRELGTSCPPLSPAAWSSFMTGCNPGRHNIYDFLTRDKKTYLPVLSSAKIGTVKKTIKIGKIKIPWGTPSVELMRGSTPFWHFLGDNGVFSTIIRVPITFPPEKFNGLLLSGMCVPDLRGTQGTFSFFTTQDVSQTATTGGTATQVTRNGDEIKGELEGPPDPRSATGANLTLPFVAKITDSGVRLTVSKETFELKVGKHSSWIRLGFKGPLGVNIYGLARFLLIEKDPNFKLYVTPINIDPERPALPVSHPYAYGAYLSKRFGLYATLGLAEDTWALNENVIDEDAFLEQVYLFHEERERMFFDALEKSKKGCVVCVFDTTDRIQHMFFRYLNEDHPSVAKDSQRINQDAVEKLYEKMDKLLGKTVEKMSESDMLFVISDHGFKDFSRGVNLNTWLCDQGYMVLKENAEGGKWLSSVDWSKTRAYALGLSGVYVNLKGRESQGIVSKKEKEALECELAEKIVGIVDTEKGGESVIGRVFRSKEVYKGPYVENAPDLVVGYREGYRSSWDSAQGIISKNVVGNNMKAWSGDHCLDPEKVPGILFTSFKHQESAPRLVDIAPTVLDLLGVPTPRHMDGKALGF